METFIKNCCLTLLGIVFVACSDSVNVENPKNQLNEIENSLIGTWRYTSITINSSTQLFTTADGYMEPNLDDEERADIDRRLLHFSREKTYQIRWDDRGTYELGTTGDPNWQPGFGFWQADESDGSLICNKSLPYEVKYTITLQGNTLKRYSTRFMSSTFSATGYPSWERGDSVLYVETFTRISEN